MYTDLRQEYAMLACVFSFPKKHAEFSIFLQQLLIAEFEMDTSLESLTCFLS